MTASASSGEVHDGEDVGQPEHFKPVGTIVVLAVFVATLILLWLSVYFILLSRGVTG